jgi:flagellar FliL protein
MTVMPNPTEPRLAPQPVPAAPADTGKKGKKGKKGKGEAADGEAPKKSKKKLFIILGVVIALIGFKEKSMFIKPHYTAAHPAPAGVIYPLANTSPFTVTTEDGHTVETDVALQCTTVASAKTLAKDEPAIENIVVAVFGGMTYGQLLPETGRQTAAAAILQQVQKLLPPVDGSPQVTGVLFTGSFVLQ